MRRAKKKMKLHAAWSMIDIWWYLLTYDEAYCIHDWYSQGVHYFMSNAMIDQQQQMMYRLYIAKQATTCAQFSSTDRQILDDSGQRLVEGSR